MKRFKRLGLAIVGLVALLAIAEGGARVAYEQPQLLAPYENDPECGYRAPSSLREQCYDRHGGYAFWTSSDGSRGRDIPYVKRLADDGETRLLFIGGTAAHARNVRDREWAAYVAERLVTLATGQRTVSYAISGDGMSLGQGLIRLRRDGRRVSPDAIVLVVRPEYDLPTMTPSLASTPADALRPYIVGEDGSRRTTYVWPVRAWLRTRSRAFAAFEARCWSLAPDAAPDDVDRSRAPLDPTRAARPPWRDAWRELDRILVDYRREAEALRARLLVLVVPSRRQVVIDPTTWVDATRALATAGSAERPRLDANLPERRIADTCDAHGIDYRLLAGVLRKELGPDAADAYDDDGRLNGIGHPWAGVAVAAWWHKEADRWGGDRDTALSTGPRSTLPVADTEPAERWLLPGHDGCLGAGWRPIASDVAGTGPGATLARRRAPVAIAARPGDLVVRGVVPADAPLPLTCAVAVPGVCSESVELVRPGPFVVRIPSPLPDSMKPPRYHGYVAVEIGEGAPERHAPVIRSVGFHVRATFEHGAPTDCNGRVWVASPLVRGTRVAAGVVGGPSDAAGLLIVARVPALVPAADAATIYVDTGAIVRAVPIATDAAGRATATIDVPADLAHRVVIQALFEANASERGYATTRALIARPLAGGER